jgi:TolA-binding protein
VADVDPFHPDAVSALLFARRELLDAGDLDEARALLDEIAETYGPASAFRRAGLADAALASHVDSAVEEALFLDAVTLHQAARAHDPADREHASSYARVRDAYSSVVLAIPHGPRASEARFLLAEAEYESGRYAHAYAAYQAVIDEGGSPFRRDAGLSSVHALERLLEAGPSRDGGECALDADAEYVVAVDRLYREVPDEPDTPAFLFRAARLLRDRGEREAASLRVRIVVTRYPGTDAARAAQDLLEP